MTALHQAFRGRLVEAIQSDPRPIKEIARLSGYSAHHIREVRRGSKTNPTLAFVETMATTLGRSPAWMLGLEEAA